MMKKITYFTVLALISAGAAPEKVRYGHKLYIWDQHDYMPEDGCGPTLSQRFCQQWTSRAQTTAEVIEVVHEP